MSDEQQIIYVRNTVSGVTMQCGIDEAARILAHAWFQKYHKRVEGPKNEVLAPPYEVDLTSDSVIDSGDDDSVVEAPIDDGFSEGEESDPQDDEE